MANKIICIGREFGSGGHEIAVRTASRLDIRVYEKDLFHLACRYGELSEKMMESADETATNPFCTGPYMRETIMSPADCPLRKCCLNCKATRSVISQTGKAVFLWAGVRTMCCGRRM